LEQGRRRVNLPKICVWIALDVTNYVGGEPSTMLLQLCHQTSNRKGIQLVTKKFLTQCFSGIAGPLQKQSIIAWVADKYTQSITTLQP